MLSLQKSKSSAKAIMKKIPHINVTVISTKNSELIVEDYSDLLLWNNLSEHSTLADSHLASGRITLFKLYKSKNK